MTASLDEAAKRIAEARIARTAFAGLPGGLQPRSETEAYDVQDRVRALLIQASFGRQVGYKIGCTTPVMQQYLNIDHPCAGTIFAKGLMRSGGALVPKDYVRPGIECEIDVELARPLEAAKGPFDLAAVSAAVGTVFAAIEVVDDRYVHWRSLGAPTLVADDFFHAGLVLGSRVTNWRAHDNPAELTRDLAALQGVAWIDGIEIGRGRGADILGSPLEALVWLANHCARRGVDLPTGTLVSLGSLIQTRWLDPGDVVEMEIERLGRVKLTFPRVSSSL